ncbi:MAG TPA: HNH endonuclease signature motif containing protein, partial [Mycobacteriales bacterium]|nr:HNH endonuclease signature motif containing protein [Mycobacteriales bacterium]
METWADAEALEARLAARFDPSRVSTADAEELVARLGRMTARLFAVQALAAARAAEGGAWRREGARTPADHLARSVRVSIGDARRLLDTGERLESLPEVREAAVAGELSAPALVAVTDAASVAPGEAARLVERAKSASHAELREECLKTKTAADPDPAATHARIHAGRRLRWWTDADTAGNFAGRGVPEDMAWLRSVIATTREELFGKARRDGVVVPSDQLDYDAFFALLRTAVGEDVAAPSHPMFSEAETAPTTSATPTRTPLGPDHARLGRRSRRAWSRAPVIVRLDAAAAERGHPLPGERCEIAGVGPVPVATVQTMLAEGASLAVLSSRVDADSDGKRRETVQTVAHVRAARAGTVDVRDPAALAAELLRTGRRVSGVVHPGRAATAHTVTALWWLNPTCAAAGCVNSRCEIDHRTGWAITKSTRLEDLDPLCRFHHNLKTHRGWALVDGSGSRPMVPPE